MSSHTTVYVSTYVFTHNNICGKIVSLLKYQKKRYFSSSSFGGSEKITPTF